MPKVTRYSHRLTSFPPPPGAMRWTQVSSTGSEELLFSRSTMNGEPTELRDQVVGYEGDEHHTTCSREFTANEKLHGRGSEHPRAGSAGLWFELADSSTTTVGRCPAKKRESEAQARFSLRREERCKIGFNQSWPDEALVGPLRSHRCIEQCRSPRPPRLRRTSEHTLRCHNITSALSWIVAKGRHSLE